MVSVAARSREDFALAEQENTRVRYDGQVELASRNQLSNPDLRDFTGIEEEDGPTADGIVLGSPEAPSGWGVYARRVQPEARLTRQTTGMLPMSRDTYRQIGPLVEGPEPQDVTRRAKIAPPFRPKVRVMELGFDGYPPGTYGLSYAWIIGRSPLRRIFPLTSPAPRVFIELSSGEGARITLPDSAPEGATGIAILMTGPRDNENQASIAPLFVQRRMNIRRGLPITYNLTGPLRREEVAPLQNQTFVGANGGGRRPRRHFRPSAKGLAAMGTQLSYMFLTEFGRSAPQARTNVFFVMRGQKNRAIWWRAPDLPPTAIAWIPMFLGSDGAWYAMRPQSPRRRSWAIINSNDPQSFPEVERPEAVATGILAEADATGLPGPDSALPEAVVLPTNSPPEGNYAIRGVLYDEDDRETPPSPHVVAKLGAGQTFEVSRPPGGNLIPNAERVALDPATGDPEGWESAPQTVDFSVSVERLRVRIEDSSWSTADEDAALSPLAELDVSAPVALRTLLDVDRHASGAVEVFARFADDGPGVVENILLGRAAQAGRRIFLKTFGPSGSGADFAYPAGATRVRIAVRMVGSSADGSRDLDLAATSFGALRGISAPPAHGWNRRVVADDEYDEDAIYPPGGSCVVVENPGRRHSDLAGINMNAVDYFSPHRTPAATDHLLASGSYQTPVRSGNTYCLSVYAEWQGVSVATNLLRTAVKDAKGETLLLNPHTITGVSGTQSPTRRHISFVAPPGASYLEIVEGGASDGYIRVMGFQLEDGTIPTPYTNENALSGYRRITLDTGLPGVPGTSRLAELGEVAEWVSASMAATDDPDVPTRVDLSFRTTDDDPLGDDPPAWSDWTADFEAVPKRRWWQVEIAMFTEDPLESSLVSYVAVEFLRGHDVLLRPDGSEYDRGMQVSIPAEHLTMLREEFVSDTNSRGFRVRGEAHDDIEGIEVEAYSKAAIRRLMKDLHENDGTVVAESRRENERYIVRLNAESVRFAREEDAYWRFDRPHHWVYSADGVSGEILSIEPLVGGEGA